MRRFFAPAIALALGALCAVVLAACGSSGAGLLSGSTADQLNTALASITKNASSGACSSAASEATSVAVQLQARNDIDPQLQNSLVQGFTHLADLARQGGTACQGVSTTTTTPTTSTATKTQKTQTQTTPTPTQTQSTPTQTQTTTTPTQTSSGGSGGTGGVGGP